MPVLSQRNPISNPAATVFLGLRHDPKGCLCERTRCGQALDPLSGRVQKFSEGFQLVLAIKEFVKHQNGSRSDERTQLAEDKRRRTVEISVEVKDETGLWFEFTHIFRHSIGKPSFEELHPRIIKTGHHSINIECFPIHHEIPIFRQSHEAVEPMKKRL